jgi:tetratricopeptide (TPR) repeat protein
VTILGIVGCENNQKISVVETPSPSLSPVSGTPSFSPPSVAERNKSAKLRQLGLQYRQQGRYTDAIKTLEESVRLDPQNLSGLVLLGWTFHLAQQPQKAEETLQKALQINSNHIQTLNALGIVYLVGGNLEQAIITHTQAIKLKPDNEIAHYNLSLAYHRQGEYNLGLTHAEKATRLEPNNPHPFVAESIIYWDSGDKNKAKKSYRQAIKLDNRYRQSDFLNHLKEAGFTSEQIKQTQKILQSL